MNGLLQRFFEPNKLVKKIPVSGPLPDVSTLLGRALRIAWPSLTESVLIGLVGMVDTMMVSSAGEAAVSGVALVDMVNYLIITVMAALTTGGAVVIS